MAYERLRKLIGLNRSKNRPPLAITQLNWQGVNYVDDSSAMLPIQVPYAKNVDFGDPIGGATKRGGLENLFTSLGSGGMEGLHTFNHSSGDLLLSAWGTALYNLTGDVGSITKTSQADWDAGTKDDTESTSSPGDIKLLHGTDFSETDTLTSDFNGTHSNTAAETDAVILSKVGTDFSETDTLTSDFNGTHSNTQAIDDAVKLAVGSGYSSDITSGNAFTANENSANAGKAFDNNTSTSWASLGGESVFPHWLKVDFGSGVTKTIIKLTIKPYDGGYGARIKNFAFQGSNNDSSWTTIHSTQCANNTNVQEFTFSNTTAYRYYRVYGTDTWDTSYNTTMQVTEIEMMVVNYQSSGIYTHTEQDISGAALANTATISFNKTTPTGTTLTVDYRIYNGSAWGDWQLNITSGATIIAKGTTLTGYKVQWRTNLSATDTTFTPELNDLTVEVVSDYNSSGTYTHGAQDVSGAQKVSASSIIFNTTTPTGTAVSMEVRLSTDGGSTWGSWTTKASGDTAITAGTLIPNYRLQWRAIITTADANVTPSLNDVTVSVTAIQATSGTWISPSIDIGNTPLTATLSWTVTTPTGTGVTWQARVSDNNSIWGDYKTINVSGNGIPLGRYVQIKTTLTGTISITSTVSDFTINFATSYTSATVIKTGLSGNRVRFANYFPKDYCIVCDGGRPFIVYKDSAGDVQVRNAGVDPPTTAPTLGDGGAGSLTGTYYGKVTYVNDDGAEGNPSSASGALVITSKQITWTIPTGPAGTAKRKLYRTKAGGATYYHVTTIENNTATTYTDTAADSLLVTAMDDKNNIPPNAKIVYEFQNYMFYVYADDETQLWFSKVGEPEQVPNIATAKNFKSFPGAILGIGDTNNALIVSGYSFVDPVVSQSTGFIFDYDPTVDTTVIKHTENTGALSHESIDLCADPELRQIMVFPTRTGVRFLLPGLQENSLESVPLSRNIQPYFDQAINRRNMSAIFYKNRYILSFTWQEPGAATASTNNVIFVYDFRSKQWTGPWTIGVNCFAIADNELYCGDAANGKVYKMFSGSSDDGSVIEMIIDLPKNSPEGIQGTYRFKRFLVEVSAESITTSTIIKAKVDNREASVSLGTLTSTFTGDVRPGHDTIRSRKFNIPLSQGNTLSHRIVDNSTNPLTIHSLVTEHEVIPVRT